MLTDAGPLVAIINRQDQGHVACIAALSTFPGPMITTWPAFTEAMYLLGRGGWPAQDALRMLLTANRLLLADPLDTPHDRVAALMERYRDHPMDLADASLVALAEARGLHQIFTLDRNDFETYRLHGRQRFEVIP